MTTATLQDALLAADRPAPGLLGLAERGLVPDALLRLGIRRLCAQRLAAEYAGGIDAWTARDQQLIARLRTSPVAIHSVSEPQPQPSSRMSWPSASSARSQYRRSMAASASSSVSAPVG